MYFDTNTEKRVSHSRISYGPDESYWSVMDLGHPVISKKDGFYLLNDKAHISTKPGAYFEYNFIGNGIRWLGNYLEDGGISEIFMDGELIDTIDQYGKITGVPWVWEWKDMHYGKHKLKVIGGKKKNPDSEGYRIDIKHISIL